MSPKNGSGRLATISPKLDKAKREHQQRRQSDVSGAANDSAPSRLERLQAVPLKFLRFKMVRDRTGLSRSTIWRLERRGDFPRHRRISTNAVGWLEQEINDWVLAKSQAS